MIEKLMVKIYGPNWKTSLNGDLAFLITAGTFLSAYLFVTPVSPRWMVVTSGVVTFIVAAGRATVGRLQVDAGQVQAIVPGEGIQTVASHEVPDAKGVKVVTKN
jgi:hypothetical protein